MLRITQARRLFKVVNRKFSTELAAAKPAESQVVKKVAETAAPVVEKSSGGSSFLQRLVAFLAGCGTGFGVCSYFVYNELVESNNKFAADLAKLSK